MKNLNKPYKDEEDIIREISLETKISEAKVRNIYYGIINEFKSQIEETDATTFDIPNIGKMYLQPTRGYKNFVRKKKKPVLENYNKKIKRIKELYKKYKDYAHKKRHLSIPLVERYAHGHTMLEMEDIQYKIYDNRTENHEYY